MKNMHVCKIIILCIQIISDIEAYTFRSSFFLNNEKPFYSSVQNFWLVVYKWVKTFFIFCENRWKCFCDFYIQLKWSEYFFIAHKYDFVDLGLTVKKW